MMPTASPLPPDWRTYGNRFSCGPRTASAQIPNAVYDDAKAVIEQLIEDDIAEEFIPNAAAQQKVICAFFPATVHAIESSVTTASGKSSAKRRRTRSV